MEVSVVIFWCLLFSILVSTSAEYCTEEKCKIENNCRCSAMPNPYINNTDGTITTKGPLFLAITITDPINAVDYETYWKPLLFDKKNPDGSPIGVTFFVSHENTDYTLVHDLYLHGHEIGVFSITNSQNKTYWATASQQDLEEEFGGQQTIISTFANIPVDHITGARTPLFQLNGDSSIKAYQSSGLSYDNSWPANNYLLPYTLDFDSTQNCLSVPNCPKESYSDFWIVPVESDSYWNYLQCTSVKSCDVNETADSISYWLNQDIGINLLQHGAPITLQLSAKWFQIVNNSYEGFAMFLEEFQQLGFLYLVTIQDILQWMQHPEPLDQYKVPRHDDRKTGCVDILCPLEDGKNQIKYMKSCVPCPEKYPWKGNPLGTA